MLCNPEESVSLDLKSVDGCNLHFNKTDKIEYLINTINDLHISIHGDVLFDTMYEMEALYSSEVEGYLTTKKDLDDLVTGKREPRNESERAVFANYMALNFGIRGIKNIYSKEFILKLNTLITDTLVLDYRLEDVSVASKTGKVMHEGVDFLEVDRYMQKLIDFMYSTKLEPLISSCIIHFYFVYVHPFIDGNGRTARALSYLYLISKGEDKYKLFSISYMLPSKRGQYYKELLKVEKNGYDLTSFIEFILETIILGLDNIKDTQRLVTIMTNVKRKFDNEGVPYSNLT
ncbi:Fic family protein, partial [Paraclostridium sordellii]